MNMLDIEKKSRTPASPGELLPSEILEIFGPPALVGSESAEKFYSLMRKFVIEFDPRTITEWFLVWDLTNNAWETIRYRRMKASLVRLESPKVTRKIV